MSIKIWNELVPIDKLDQFDEILKSCGGRYLCNPEQSKVWSCWRVSYEYDTSEALNRHGKIWRRITTNIKEVRNDQWWRKLLRRIGIPI